MKKNIRGFIPLLAGLGVLIPGVIWVKTLFDQWQTSSNEAQVLFQKKSQTALVRPGGMEKIQNDLLAVTKACTDLRASINAVCNPGLEAWGIGQPWSTDPGQWKDRLIQINESIQKESVRLPQEGKVAISGEFYLGFDPYRQKSPNPEDVPNLARQLSVAQRLVDHLLASRRQVKEPFPTPCILNQLVIPGGALSESSSPAPTVLPPSRQKSAEPTANPVREAYTISLDCSPEVFADFLGRLASDPWIFVPMDIRVENEQASFPKREDFEKLLTAPVAASGNDPSGQAAPPASPLLLVLAGKERLRVRISVDFVFLPPEKDEKPKEKGS